MLTHRPRSEAAESQKESDMGSVTEESFRDWLGRYGRAWAWEEEDLAAAATLYTESVEYYETPFDDPLIGAETILRYSQEAAETQEDVDFSCRALSVEGNRGIAHWQVEFLSLSRGKSVELGGVLLAEFADPTRCSLFREWWHLQESSGVDQEER